MSRRLLELIGVVTVVVTVTVLLSLATVPVVAQATTAPGQAGAAAKKDPPTTQWGEPDLQGIWTND